MIERMFRLDKHIEVLLMKCDCVVLPRFGGFVKHHVNAQIDKSNGVILPPKETVGFNPQLTLNDSLLVQSYVEAYDYSYPEALSVVEEDVDELRDTLHRQGRYEIGSIGTLSINNNGTVTFEPLPSGTLVPQLYGLSTIETASSTCFIKHEEVTETHAIIDINETKSTESDFVIRISRRTLRRLAAACVALMIIASIPFIGKNVHTRELTSGVNPSFLYTLAPKAGPANDANVKNLDTTTAIEESTEVTTNVDQNAGSVVTERPYTVVLASKISEKNATRFVEELHNNYNISAKIMPQGKNYRVICGGYATKEEAQQARQSLASNTSLSDAWIALLAEL